MKKVLLSVLLFAMLLLAGCSSQDSGNDMTGEAIQETELQPAPAQETTNSEEIVEQTAPETEMPAQIVPGPTGDKTFIIVIKNSYFNPTKAVVALGTTVTWINDDPERYGVRAFDGEFKSPVLLQGESWSYTFNKTGNFLYRCSTLPKMQGEIVVVDRI